MEVRNRLHMSVALAVFALISILATIPVVDTLFAGNIGILDAERVKTVVLAAGFVLLFGSCGAVVVFWNKTQKPRENPRER